MPIIAVDVVASSELQAPSSTTATKNSKFLPIKLSPKFVSYGMVTDWPMKYKSVILR
jgi:hypothetical protein